MKQLAQLIHQDMAPAYGVTEPGAIAYACALARAQVPQVESIWLGVNSGIYKNAFTCAIPGTEEEGCAWAAALGALGGDAEKGLAALENLSEGVHAQAKALLEQGAVTVEMCRLAPEIFIEARVEGGGHRGVARLENTHTGLTYLEKDGVALKNDPPSPQQQDPCQEICGYTLKELCQYVRQAPLEEFLFLEDALAMNQALLQAGEQENKLPLTRALAGNRESILDEMTYLACGAIEARVRGASAPAMSLTGSGSHGILATMPLLGAAQKSGKSREDLLRALALSCLVTIYIKEYSGRLSALCGCALAGGTGTACGLVLLFGGSDEQIALAVQNMAASLTGMICHGGNQGCALKARAGVQCAWDMSCLALQSLAVDSRHSILGQTPEKTMQNMGRIACPGMTHTEETILEILSEK